MIITKFRVSITKNGDGLISYEKNRRSYRVLLSKDDKVIREIFNQHYSLLPDFKNRHYAIAKWIVRDIRAEGYVFRSYSNNFQNIRPIKQFSKLQNKLNQNWKVDSILRNRHHSEVSEFERLLH
jgi:hypothetical protein